jgi:hypothetical protein
LFHGRDSFRLLWGLINDMLIRADTPGGRDQDLSAGWIPLDTHDYIPRRIQTDDKTILEQPVAVLRRALLGWQERQRSLEAIETEMAISRDVDPPTAKQEAIAGPHARGASSTHLLHYGPQITQKAVVVTFRILAMGRKHKD